jgi:hypothetical protein
MSIEPQVNPGRFGVNPLQCRVGFRRAMPWMESVGSRGELGTVREAYVGCQPDREAFPEGWCWEGGPMLISCVIWREGCPNLEEMETRRTQPGRRWRSIAGDRGVATGDG